MTAHSANDHEFNLKHRVTGAAILIGIAVVFVSMLLGRPASTIRVEFKQAPKPVSFVSRIVSDELARSQGPAKEISAVPVGEETPASDAPVITPAPQPVLDRAVELPKPVVKLNTVPVQKQPRKPPARPDVSAKTESAAVTWVVRVGAFSRKSNADKVIKQLRSSKFNTSSASIQVNGKTMIRVWIGPYKDRKEAVRAKSKVSKGLGLNGFVSRG